jgi:hypothetical protein
MRRRDIILKILLKYLDLNVVNREVQYTEAGQKIVALFIMCLLPILWDCMRMCSLIVEIFVLLL